MTDVCPSGTSQRPLHRGHGLKGCGTCWDKSHHEAQVWFQNPLREGTFPDGGAGGAGLARALPAALGARREDPAVRTPPGPPTEAARGPLPPGVPACALASVLVCDRSLGNHKVDQVQSQFILRMQILHIGSWQETHVKGGKLPLPHRGFRGAGRPRCACRARVPNPRLCSVSATCFRQGDTHRITSNFASPPLNKEVTACTWTNLREKRHLWSTGPSGAPSELPGCRAPVPSPASLG